MEKHLIRTIENETVIENVGWLSEPIEKIAVMVNSMTDVLVKIRVGGKMMDEESSSMITAGDTIMNKKEAGKIDFYTNDKLQSI